MGRRSGIGRAGRLAPGGAGAGKGGASGIPPLQRMAVYGSYVERRSHREMAELLNRPVGTVKSLIRYGIHNVRRRLDAMSGKEGELAA